LIGRSEEKLRPRSIFLRRIIARYVVWIEIVGYALVFALFGALIYASQVKADDDFLPSIPGTVNLKLQVVQASKDAQVSAIAPDEAEKRPARVGTALVTLEESPEIVTRTSLRQNLEKQREFARTQKRDEVVAQIDKMLEQVQPNPAAHSALRPLPAKFTGKWVPAVKPGQVVTSGTVLGILLSPAETTVDIETKAPPIAQNGGKLKPDQPTTISLTMGKTEVILLGKVTRGGKKNPAIAITEITPAEAAKIMDFYRDNPYQNPSFPTENIKVLVGEKSWASLIWK